MKAFIKRWLIRLLLLSIAAGIGALGVQLWWQTRPETIARKARQALRQDQTEIAELAYLNLLQRTPQDPDAYLALAQLYEDQGASEKRLATLVLGTEQVPNNVDLQRSLMWAHLNNDRTQAAAAVAPKVAELDETDFDAKFLKAWRDIATGLHSDTPATIDQLERQRVLLSLHTSFLRVQLHRETGDDEQLQEALQFALEELQRFPAERLADLFDWDRDFVETLLVWAVEHAPDGQTADWRALGAFDVLDKLLAAESYGPATANRVAGIASRLVALNQKTHSEADDASPRPTPSVEIARRLEHFGKAAIDAGQATLALYLTTAEAALWQDRPERAVDTAKQGIAAASPQDGASNETLQALHLFAAGQLLILGRLDEAEVHLEVLMADPSTSARGNLLSGEVAVREGRMQQALKHLMVAQKEMGLIWPVRVLLARIHLALSNWRETLAYLDFVQEAYDKQTEQQRTWAAQYLGDPSQITLSRARACLELNRLDDAMEHIGPLIDTPQEPRALQLLFAYYARRGDPAQARQILDDAREKYPGDLGLLLAEADLLRSAGQADQADQMIRKFVGENPDDLPSQLLKVQQLLQEEDTEGAWELIEQFESRFADSPVLKLVKAHVLLAMGRNQEALDLAGQLGTIPEAGLSGLEIACLATLRLDNPDLAADVFESAAEESSRSGLFKMWRAGLAFAQEDYESAVDLFSQSTPFTTLQTTARAALLDSVARLAQQQGIAHAEAKVDQLLEAYPREPALLIAKADLAFRQRRFQDAIEQLDRLRDTQPNSATTHCLKARAWAACKRPDYAWPQLREALRLDAEHIPSHITAVGLCLAAKQYDRALEHAQALVKLDEGSYDPQIVFAEVLYQGGRQDEAIKVLDRLIETQPDLPAAHLALASIYEEIDDLDKALKTICSAAVQIPDDIRVVEKEVILLCRAGRCPEARALARTFARGRVPDWMLVDLGEQLALSSTSRLPSGTVGIPFTLGQIIAQRSETLVSCVPWHDSWPPTVAEVAKTFGLSSKTPRLLASFATGEFSFAAGLGTLPFTLAQNLHARFSERPDTNLCLRLGTAFQRGDQGQIARLWFHRALVGAADGKRPEIHMTLGQSCLTDFSQHPQKELVIEAVRHFEDVLRAQPAHLIAGNNLAWLLCTELDDPQTALDIALQVRSDRPIDQLPVSFVGTLCTIYREMGKFDEAFQLLAKGKESYSHDSLLNFQLGMTHAARGEATEAYKALRTALRLGLQPDLAAQAQRTIDEITNRAASTN